MNNTVLVYMYDCGPTDIPIYMVYVILWPPLELFEPRVGTVSMNFNNNRLNIFYLRQSSSINYAIILTALRLQRLTYRDYMFLHSNGALLSAEQDSARFTCGQLVCYHLMIGF